MRKRTIPTRFRLAADPELEDTLLVDEEIIPEEDALPTEEELVDEVEKTPEGTVK